MMIDTVSNFTKGAFGIFGIVLLIVAVLCLVPMLALWTLNTLAELGGSSFYIEHSLFSYFVIFVAVALLRGGDTNKSA